MIDELRAEGRAVLENMKHVEQGFILCARDKKEAMMNLKALRAEVAGVEAEATLDVSRNKEEFTNAESRKAEVSRRLNDSELVSELSRVESSIAEIDAKMQHYTYAHSRLKRHLEFLTALAHNCGGRDAS